MPWHSSERGVKVFHFDVRCAQAEAIAPQHFRDGEGGKRPCPACVTLKGAVPVTRRGDGPVASR